jgi:diguanylate cyclase (GGDEF)-like protein
MAGRDDKTGGTAVLKSVTAVKDDASALLVMLHPAGGNLGRRFSLTSKEHLVGRLAELDIPIESDSVSRRHARFMILEGAWHVEDLGSTNGTFVNDTRITPSRKLHDGDIIRFGEAVVKFLAGSNVEAAYHEEIYRMSIMDGLTGVHNKRFFQEFLERELARVNRHGGSLGLVLFDIDHFKSVNDTHGHLAGDAVLKELCRRLKARIRREDLLARYGGEEFAAVLPDTQHAGALAFCESLRALVARDPFVVEGASLPVTISLGLAMYDASARFTSAELVRRADENLYAAKRAGRNRVVG